MNKEEIDEIDKLEIDFNDIDELNLALEVSSKKAMYLLDEFSKTIINLQQENKQLKDNWNKLKEKLKKIDNFQRNWNDFPNTIMTPYNAILEIMQELEKRDSND